jgi:hypothetical protein
LHSRFEFDKAESIALLRRRYVVAPTPAKPRVSMAHVEGSGTAEMLPKFPLAKKGSISAFPGGNTNGTGSMGGGGANGLGGGGGGGGSGAKSGSGGSGILRYRQLLSRSE